MASRLQLRLTRPERAARPIVRSPTLAATIVSFQRVGVPLRLIQYVLLHSGPAAAQAALAMRLPDEYTHVKMVRAGIEADQAMDFNSNAEPVPVPAIYSGDCT